MAKKSFKQQRSNKEEVKEFEEEVLQIDRVTRVVKGGRRLRFRCTVAIGDKKGRVGVGIGKASEVVNGIKKAIDKAKKNLIKVDITEDGTIPHQIRAKYKASKMLILPASPGTGVIAGGALRKILNLAGIKNVLSKNFGTNNKVVNAQAAILALQQLRPVRKVKKSEDKKEESASVEATVSDTASSSAKVMDDKGPKEKKAKK